MNPQKILNQLLLTFKKFFEAIAFISKNGLSKYYIYPIILTILLWIGGFALIKSGVTSISDWTHQYLNIESSPSGEGFFSSFSESWEMIKSWVNGASTIALTIILKIVFWIVLGVITKYLLLILLSPILAFVSEKAESIVNGKSYPFDVNQFVRDIWRGMLIAIRNLFIELGIIIVLFVISFFAPILTPFTAIISLVIGAYFYGYSMLDYIAERRRLSLGDSSKFVMQYAGIALALGLIIAFSMKVFILGFLIASFASIVSAVAAVLMMNTEKVEEGRLHSSEKIIQLKEDI